MLYVLFIIAVLIAVVLSLRIRFRVQLSSERQLLFVGLGRSGPEWDFATRAGAIKIFGLKIKTLRPTPRTAKKKPDEKPPKKKKKPARHRPIGDILKVVPGVTTQAIKSASLSLRLSWIIDSG